MQTLPGSAEGGRTSTGVSHPGMGTGVYYDVVSCLLPPPSCSTDVLGPPRDPQRTVWNPKHSAYIGTIPAQGRVHDMVGAGRVLDFGHTLGECYSKPCHSLILRIQNVYRSRAYSSPARRLAQNTAQTRAPSPRPSCLPTTTILRRLRLLRPSPPLGRFRTPQNANRDMHRSTPFGCARARGPVPTLVSPQLNDCPPRTGESRTLSVLRPPPSSPTPLVPRRLAGPQRAKGKAGRRTVELHPPSLLRPRCVPCRMDARRERTGTLPAATFNRARDPVPTSTVSPE